MWTFIPKNDVESFLNNYPSLAEIFNNINLYETEDNIFLPRLFYKNFQNGVKIFESDDNEILSYEPTFFKFTGKLRQEQIEIVQFILNSYKQNKNQINGIIKARPGLGKTVLSTYIAAKLGIKTCIIIDNENLLNQWVEAFLTFTDLKAEEIGLIKSKHFIIDKPVIIATVQTLLSKIKTNMHKNFKIINDAKIGLVIYDEVHNTSSSSKFAKASLLFKTKNVLGLSATPFQIGAAEILMKNTIGEIIYETKHYELKPIYVLNHYDSGLTGKYTFVLGKITDYIKRKSFYNSIIIKSKMYLELIVKLVKQRSSEGHTILILCFTKAQVKLFSERLEKENIKHRRFYGDEKESLDKENENIIIVTYAYAGKGFDFERLSNIILTTNLAGKKSLIQVIGRILRKTTENRTKLQPIVDDLIDVGFPSIFLPDLRAKKAIVKDEFNCEIINVNHNNISDD